MTKIADFGKLCNYKFSFISVPSCPAVHLFRRSAQQIQLLLKSAEIANFDPEVRKKYIQDMTTAQDIANQLAYARKEGLKEGLKMDVAELEG